MSISKDTIVDALRVRYDSYSAETVFEMACQRADLQGKTTFENRELAAFRTALEKVGDRVGGVLARIDEMLGGKPADVKDAKSDKAAPAEVKDAKSDKAAPAEVKDSKSGGAPAEVKDAKSDKSAAPAEAKDAKSDKSAAPAEAKDSKSGGSKPSEAKPEAKS
jgi:hypothetical protein